jgi:hypothetical protein|tara:strand:+ start:102 stop:260 length:159 start_codon:yes stop_codon:yes gene_type:complete
MESKDKTTQEQEVKSTTATVEGHDQYKHNVVETTVTSLGQVAEESKEGKTPE